MVSISVRSDSVLQESRPIVSWTDRFRRPLSKELSVQEDMFMNCFCHAGMTVETTLLHALLRRHTVKEAGLT